MSNLIVSPSPHLHSGNSLEKIMVDIMIALLPCVGFAIYLFGIAAIKVIIISMISAVLWEVFFQVITRRPIKIKDLTSLCYGLIFAMVLPPTLPWWIILVGTFFLVLLGKEIYGGYGTNPFNGVLISWVILKMSFPDYMGKWIVPLQDIATSKTPLEVFKSEGIDFVHHYFSYSNMFWGFVPGFMGQISGAAIIAGGLYLILRKRINWRIPVSYILGLFIFSGIFWLLGSSSFGDPIFHLLSGGALFVAFFLATDIPSTPVTPQGMVLFGLFAGMLTVIIRVWGTWTFGAYYAVLIISLITPFLDKITPEPYGR